MDFRHLKYFVAVAQERSFTRAAERLYISQPPLSRQIQQLEEELGLKLLDREARPLALTEAGRFFHARAVRMLEQLDETIAMTRRLSQVDRRLVIGFVPSTMYGALPRIARLFRARRPQVPLVLVEKTTVEQGEALKAGQIDVGFGRVRFDDPSLRREVLREEPLVLAIPHRAFPGGRIGAGQPGAGGGLPAAGLSAQAAPELCRPYPVAVPRPGPGAGRGAGGAGNADRARPGCRRHGAVPGTGQRPALAARRGGLPPAARVERDLADHHEHAPERPVRDRKSVV